MKHVALLLIAIAFRAGALAQALPESPQPQAQLPAPPPASPAPPADEPSMWDSIEHLPRGEKIKIRISGRRWERCEFAGATDAFLYCAPDEGSDAARAWQIDRAAIADFKLDHDVRNGRIAFATGVVSVGLALGLQSTRVEGAAVFHGMLGGLLGIIPGGIASCALGHCIVPTLPAPAPSYAIGVNLPLRRIPRYWRR